MTGGIPRRPCVPEETMTHYDGVWVFSPAWVAIGVLVLAVFVGAIATAVAR